MSRDVTGVSKYGATSPLLLLFLRRAGERHHLRTVVSGSRGHGHVHVLRHMRPNVHLHLDRVRVAGPRPLHRPHAQPLRRHGVHQLRGAERRVWERGYRQRYSQSLRSAVPLVHLFYAAVPLTSRVTELNGVVIILHLVFSQIPIGAAVERGDGTQRHLSDWMGLC